MQVRVLGDAISHEEEQAYIDHAQAKFFSALEGLDILVDGDEVELTYYLGSVPFERIRRITGYLVGTMDKWNDAKRAEESERVKHELSA